VVRFIREHFVFGAAGAFAFLAADALDLVAFGGDKAALPFLDFIEQQTPGNVTVQPLLAGFLAFDLQTGRPMHEHDAGRGLIDVLAAVAAGAHEAFLDVRFIHTQFGHAPCECCFFFQADRECAHDWGIRNEKGRVPKEKIKREKTPLPPRGSSVAYIRLQ
jgi:hypothetical protein